MFKHRWTTSTIIHPYVIIFLFPLTCWHNHQQQHSAKEFLKHWLWVFIWHFLFCFVHLPHLQFVKYSSFNIFQRLFLAWFVTSFVCTTMIFVENYATKVWNLCSLKPYFETFLRSHFSTSSMRYHLFPHPLIYNNKSTLLINLYFLPP